MYFLLNLTSYEVDGCGKDSNDVNRMMISMDDKQHRIIVSSDYDIYRDMTIIQIGRVIHSINPEVELITTHNEEAAAQLMSVLKWSIVSFVEFTSQDINLNGTDSGSAIQDLLYEQLESKGLKVARSCPPMPKVKPPKPSPSDNPHTGGSLDDLLEECGILEEVTIGALERVNVHITEENKKLKEELQALKSQYNVLSQGLVKLTEYSQENPPKSNLHFMRG